MNRNTLLKIYQEKSKELELHMACGDKFELHNHDVDFEEDYIVCDKDEEGTILFYDHIVAVDWHESGWA